MQEWFPTAHGKIILFFRTKEVSFDVYQRTSDKPVLRIAKNFKPNYFNEKFFIKDKMEM